MTAIEIRLLEQAAADLRRRLPILLADDASAEARLPELLAKPPAARREAVREDDGLASPALGYALRDRAEPLLETDPMEAMSLAQLAASIGRRLATPWTPLEAELLQGSARSLEGEALRRLGRWAEARQAHARAFRHFESLPVGSLQRTYFCRYLARLRRDQGRDDEALALMARTLERLARFPGGWRAQECRLELAWMQLEALEAQEAVVLFEAARAEEARRPGWWRKGVDGTEGSKTPAPGAATERWLSLRHGLALAYADRRREAEAGLLLAEIRQGSWRDSDFDPLRAKRIEASILQRLDADEEAAELLFAAWSGYALAGRPYEAVLSLLELAQLRAEQGSTQELERLKQGVAGLAGLRANLREPLLEGLDLALRQGLAGIERLEALRAFTPWARFDSNLRFTLNPPDGEDEGGERE